MTTSRRLSLPEAIDIVERFAAGHVTASDTYFAEHLKRYAVTLCHISFAAHEQARCLEIGATPLFQWALKSVFGYAEVEGTYFGGGAPVVRAETIRGPDYEASHKAHWLNIENDRLLVDDQSYDFVMCCEVLEHMDVDPMALMGELNRAIKHHGQLLVTTPNSTSARIVAKILSGHAPHFFMQYVKSRDPYRHNFEYDPHLLLQLMQAAGFDADNIATIDTFHEPPPGIIEFLARNGFPTEARGDNIFYSGHKAGPIRERHPVGIYMYQPDVIV